MVQLPVRNPMRRRVKRGFTDVVPNLHRGGVTVSPMLFAGEVEALEPTAEKSRSRPHGPRAGTAPLPRPKKVEITGTQQSHGFKEQMKIGAAFAAQLDVVTPLAEAAKIIGISKTMLRRIECRAFYKVAMRMRALDLTADL